MVNSLLKTTGLRLRYVEETGSTNADLLEDGSAASGSVLIAGRQSAGRGACAEPSPRRRADFI